VDIDGGQLVVIGTLPPISHAAALSARKRIGVASGHYTVEQLEAHNAYGCFFRRCRTRGGARVDRQCVRFELKRSWTIYAERKKKIEGLAGRAALSFEGRSRTGATILPRAN